MKSNLPVENGPPPLTDLSPRHRRRWWVLLFILVLVGPFAAYSGWRIYSYDWVNFNETFPFPHPISDVRRYPVHLANWQSSGVVAHFPAEVPADASSVIYSQQSAFGQGGGDLQLRLTLPTARIDAIEQQASADAMFVVDSGPPPTGWAAATRRNQDKLLARDWTSGNRLDYPADFKFYVLHSTYRKDRTENPEYQSGIAISRLRGQVIYWAVEWR